MIYPELGEALEWIEFQPKGLTEATILMHVGQNLKQFNQTIVAFLKVRLRGKARVWLKSQPTGEGLLT